MCDGGLMECGSSLPLSGTGTNPTAQRHRDQPDCPKRRQAAALHIPEVHPCVQQPFGVRELAPAFILRGAAAPPGGVKVNVKAPRRLA
jgi:hypothetical protein